MNRIKQFKNNTVLLYSIWKASPMRILMEAVNMLLQIASSMLVHIILLKYILDLTASRTSYSIVIFVVGLAAVIDIFALCFQSWLDDCFRPSSNAYIHQCFQLKLYRQAVKIDLSCYDNEAFYNQYILAAKDSSQRALDCMNDMFFLLRTVIELIVCGGIIIAGEPVLLLVAVLPAVLFGLVDAKIQGYDWKLSKELAPDKRRRDYFKRVFYMGRYAKEIRSSEVSGVLFRHFEDSNHHIIHKTKKAGARLLPLNSILLPIFYFQYVAIMAYLAWRALVAKNISVGDFALLMGSANTLSANWRSIAGFMSRMLEHALYAESFLGFVRKEPAITAVEPCREINAGMGDIIFSDVAFKYGQEGEDILQHLCIEIPAGKKVALVGANGAGKSTLIKLLLRLYDPQAGHISMGGTDIRHFSPEAYRKHFGLVFQDYQSYPVSVAENILFERPRTPKDRQRVEDILKIAGLYEKVRSLPEGIDTVVTKEFSEDGVVFSGGELQKLAIARALAQNPEILILDEPSSALDPIMEYEVNQAMLQAMKNKTVVLISHRLSTVRDADIIYLIQDGCVREKGTHAELMRNGGEYKKMFELQASQF